MFYHICSIFFRKVKILYEKNKKIKKFLKKEKKLKKGIEVILEEEEEAEDEEDIGEEDLKNLMKNDPEILKIENKNSENKKFSYFKFFDFLTIPIKILM